MVRYYKGIYYAGDMSDSTADVILKLRTMPCVENLRHSIYELSDNEIDDIIKAYEVDNRGETLPAPHLVYKQGTLRDDQTIGAAFMFFAKSSLLGDDVGLGKTVEVAGFLNALRRAKLQAGNTRFNFLFLTESNSVVEIRRKIIKFTGRYVHLLESGKKTDVVKYVNSTTEGNYSVVGTHSLLHSTEFLSYCAQKEFDAIIFDESSNARNATGNSISYRNLKLLMSKIEYRVLLNATPIEVALEDMYNQFALLDSTFLPPVRDFEALFCVKKRVGCRFKICGFKNLDIFKRATTLRYLARTRKELGAVYADNKASLFVLEQTALQKSLQKSTSLYQQLADFPPAISYDVDTILENVPKIWATLAILAYFKLKSEKVMIYCNYIACQDMLKEYLEKYGYTVAVLNGSTATKQRSVILQDFHDNKYNVLLTNTRRSLDLQDCNHCIIYTIDGSPLKTVQVEGRLTRDFNVQNKNIYVLCMDGRELKTLYGVVYQRASMAETATVKNNSLYTSLLLRDDKIMYKIPAGAYKGDPEGYVFVQEHN